MLRQALREGEVTVVVARDENVHRFKGYSPRQPLQERMEAIVSAFPSIRVVAGDASDMQSAIRAIQPDLILLGYDQQLPPGMDESLLGVPTRRLRPHYPSRFKSSLLRPRRAREG